MCAAGVVSAAAPLPQPAFLAVRVCSEQEWAALGCTVPRAGSSALAAEE